MKKLKKVLLTFLILSMISLILVGIISKADILGWFSSGEKITINDTNAMKDTSGKIYYCVEPGLSIASGEFTESGSYTITNQQLAYICSLTDDSRIGYYYMGPKQNALWHWIYTNENSTTLTGSGLISWLFGTSIGEAFGNTGADGINIGSGDYQGTSISFYNSGGNFTYEKYIENMKKVPENYTISPSLNISLINNDTQVKVEVSGLPAGTYSLYEKNSTSKNVVGTITVGTSGSGSCTINVEKFTNSEIAVCLDYKEEYYQGNITVYKHAENTQRVAKISGEKIYQDKTKTSNTVDLKIDVSLQKYIIKVADTKGNVSYYDKTNRNNMKTASDDTTNGCNRSASSTSGTVKNEYKYNLALEIENGDLVTYRIYVYNNDKNKAKDVEIKDYLPHTKDSSLVTVTSILKNSSANCFVTRLGNYITWQTGEIAGNSSIYYDVTLQFTKYNSNILINTAEISSTTPTNDTKYRTVDRDYVQMKEYKVSLEKYVSGVESTGKTGTALITDTNSTLYNSPKADRSGYQTYSKEKTWKQDNPVMVEAGDKVTYTIKLTNKGSTYIKSVIVKDTCPTGLKYSSCSGVTYSNGTITYSNGIDADKSVTFTLTYEVTEAKADTLIQNTATIDHITNRNDTTVLDSDGPDNNTDSDWIKTKEYKVSLEKYITEASGNTVTGRENHPKYKENEFSKDNNPYEVNNGDLVIYTIKLTNTGDNYIQTVIVTDECPQGLKYNSCNGVTCNGAKFTYTGGLAKGESKYFTITYKVTAPNISTEIIKNTANITQIKNKNDYEVNDNDGEWNNEDADYIQLGDITIKGKVWNDRATGKESNTYDGEYNSGEYNSGEPLLEGITVKLFNETKNTIVDDTKTDANGEYSFPTQEFRGGYIKGPKTSGIDRWAGTHYNYYVIFEYDGITYTSAYNGDNNSLCKAVSSTNEKDSNAQECIEDNDVPVKLKNIITSRTKFNSDWSTIDNTKDIKYDTKNDNGYMPQSNYQTTNNQKMIMQSSTELIKLDNTATTQNALQHVNLGLRGRDVFDLELSSKVDNVKVTVNGQDATYKHESNVKLRKSDINNNTTHEDMTNIYGTKDNNGEYINKSGSEISNTQNIRKSDIDPTNSTGAISNTNTGTTQYSANLLAVEVTYEFTVKNASQTHGAVTKFIDYYDKKYEYQTVYAKDKDNKIIIISEDGKAQKEDSFDYVEFSIDAKELEQGEEIKIYVVLELKEADQTLKDLADEKIAKIPTYNMGEIAEYKTYAVKGNERARGLIDKDSAPGSANTEIVRLSDGSSNLTTVQYYFAGNNLEKLKYEDDTDTSPVLYFAISDKARNLTGNVFEDIAKLNSSNVKSGNGIKDDEELGIYGVTVSLIEIKDSEEYVRYKTTSGTNGDYEFKNFLPGQYKIKFEYGDTEATFLYDANNSDSVNKKSYNGEDFQSTNNSKIIDGLDTNQLSTEKNYWYLDNEDKGISIATDNSNRRASVSNNVVKFYDDEDKLKVLNLAREGKNETYIESQTRSGIVDGEDGVIAKTKMDAETADMIFNVEKDDNGNTKSYTEPLDYYIKNMNFGITEVPVTTVDLRKTVDSFKITDASGSNTIVSAETNSDGNLEVSVGDGLIGNSIDISIEDEKLQGARLEVTYKITANKKVEKNFDGTDGAKEPGITGLIDFIDNNLSYNKDLGENSNYWDLISYLDVQNAFNSSYSGTNPRGTIDPNGEKYSVVLKAKGDINKSETAIYKLNNNESIPITLEKVLSSTDATLEEIITSTVDSFSYANIVEITGLQYDNSNKLKDRIRTSKRYIIVPGAHYDSATSETITIHPPTGTSEINIIYYVISAIALAILAAGIFGVKKYVVKK